jgi:hypothetical protein
MNLLILKMRALFALLGAGSLNELRQVLQAIIWEAEAIQWDIDHPEVEERG